MTKTTLLFLHLPKAGGSTLRHLLHRQFPQGSVHKIESDINGDIKALHSASDDEKQTIQLITGHMSFGLHALFDQPCQYITLLREPVARVVSEYQFLVSNEYHVLHPQVVNMTLAQYLESDLSSQISNGQTRLLAGLVDDNTLGIPGHGEVREPDYLLAKANLQQHFVHPATLAHYDAALVRWQQTFGWSWLWYERANVTPKFGNKPTPAEIERIKALNQWDMALYQDVLLWEQQALDAQSWLFKVKLAVFRWANPMYGKARSLKRRLRLFK